MLKREIASTVLQSILPVFAGVIAMRKEKLANAQYDRVVFWVACAGVVATLIAGFLRVAFAYYKDQKEADATSPQDLAGCLHVLHRLVYQAKGLDPADRTHLRLTVYKVEGDVLTQLVDYVGGDETADRDNGRVATRKFSVRAGMIGRVARAGKARILDRPANHPFKDWVAHLVENLGMKPEEAEKTNQDRFSFCAVPLVSGGKVDAVLYLDAKDTGFFDKATEDLVLQGCAGLSTYASLRYG